MTSHPMWVRGLKLGVPKSYLGWSKSHPMWVRGLKPLLDEYDPLGDLVAPYVGAWIETIIGYGKMLCQIGRTLCGCVD